MAGIIRLSPRAFAVCWRDVERWDPSSFHQISWHWPDEVMKPLGSVLTARKEKINRSKVSFSDLQPITIHFDGSIDKREVDANREYTMELYAAHPGDIVVAKIDLKNGAAAIVPNDWTNVAVTNHFAVYAPDRSRLFPEYLHLLVQTSFFKSHLWRNKVGAEGRKEVKLDFFEAERIPLPPLPAQRKIVAAHEAARQKVDSAREGLIRLVSDLDAELRRFARLNLLKQPWLVARWKDLVALDMKSARAAIYKLDNPTFRPLGEFAEEATDLVKPWEEPEKDWPVYGVNNKEGVFFSHLQKGKAFNAPYKRIRKDWFFHNPTRSNVGSLGIVPDVPNDAITSPEYQVWRIKSGMLPGFVATLIGTQFFIDLIQIHRVGAVKQRLYVDNLLQIPIPVIPDAAQRKIADRRELIMQEIDSAQASAELAKADVEAMIVGTKPV